jgi:hypothetical protein
VDGADERLVAGCAGRELNTRLLRAGAPTALYDDDEIVDFFYDDISNLEVRAARGDHLRGLA